MNRQKKSKISGSLGKCVPKRFLNAGLQWLDEVSCILMHVELQVTASMLTVYYLEGDAILPVDEASKSWKCNSVAKHSSARSAEISVNNLCACTIDIFTR